MFDMGWSELLVIGVVALIVVGPKDLPILFRRVGQFVGKAKGMAREFTQAMNDAADESGVREVSSNLNKSLKAATNPLGSAMDGVKSATKGLADFNPDSETGKLAAKRAEERRKAQEDVARKVAEREALKDNGAAPAPETQATPATPPAAAETAQATTAKTAAVASPAASTSTSAKATTAAASGTAAAKAASPKAPAAKKPAAKKAAPKTAAAKKPAAKKPAAAKTASASKATPRKATKKAPE